MFYRQTISLMRRLRFSAQTCRRSIVDVSGSCVNTSNTSLSYHYESQISLRNRKPGAFPLWILVCSQAAIFVGMNGNVAFAEDDTEGDNLAELRRIDDGSVVSNIHTSKWRIFTDKGRNLSQQGKLQEAERFFLSALQEAKEGFGEKDPHVASACNNLAELYRVQKAFTKAEPFYLESVRILEESFGPDDVRVGAALHNLGQFYLVQRKLEEAHSCYERALKIKGRVLGHGHSDYADTMYHLGTVMYLEGKERDSVTLILNSIEILEEGGQGESITCLRRLSHLSQIYLKSNRLTEAENVQRKILHIMEVAKGWNSLDTVIAAEHLALTLRSIGNLKEAKELLQQCLEVRKSILPEDHIQIGANMLHMARVALLSLNESIKVDFSKASVGVAEAKVLLDNSIRIAQKSLYGPRKNRGNPKDEHAALVILLQSFITLGLLEISKQELQESRNGGSSTTEAEHAFSRCITAFKKAAHTEHLRSICNSPDVKAEYLTCLKHLRILINESVESMTQSSREATLQELKDEIKGVEADLSQNKKRIS